MYYIVQLLKVNGASCIFSNSLSNNLKMQPSENNSKWLIVFNVFFKHNPATVIWYIPEQRLHLLPNILCCLDESYKDDAIYLISELQNI